MGVGFWLELGKLHYGYCLDYDNLRPKQAEVAFFKDAQSLGLKVKKESRKRLPVPKFGEWLVALYLMEGDFHFIRRNTDGGWCHKQGEEPAEQLSCIYPPDRIGTYEYVGTYSVSINERS